jgi:hypothetical protein
LLVSGVQAAAAPAGVDRDDDGETATTTDTPATVRRMAIHARSERLPAIPESRAE